MRFVYSDPYTPRGAVQQMAGSEPVATGERELPIPVDVYQLDNAIVIEGAIPGARLEDLELSCEGGLLTVQGQVSGMDRDYAVQEIPRGRFSRTLVLPAECEVDGATASFENGIIRITIPRPRQRVTQTIKVQVGKSGEPSRSTKDKPDVIEAVKGRGYREVALKSGRRKGRQK
jgi:HSP20 family molecular chaperone IbpA